MIVDMVTGDILQSDCRHIVFAVNCEGYNDAGFAGMISRRFNWPELMNTGPVPLGRVFRRPLDGRTFHAVACHSLEEENGWGQTAGTLENALNMISDSDGSIGIVQVGGGPVGQMSGADPYAILGGVARSTTRVTVYRLGR